MNYKKNYPANELAQEALKNRLHEVEECEDWFANDEHWGVGGT